MKLIFHLFLLHKIWGNVFFSAKQIFNCQSEKFSYSSETVNVLLMMFVHILSKCPENVHLYSDCNHKLVFVDLCGYF